MKKTIQVLEDMLRCFVTDFQGEQHKHLPLVKFSYNNSNRSMVGMIPYEALYGKRCITLHCWHESRDKLEIGPELIRKMAKKIKLIQEWIRAANNRK